MVPMVLCPPHRLSACCQAMWLPMAAPRGPMLRKRAVNAYITADVKGRAVNAYVTADVKGRAEEALLLSPYSLLLPTPSSCFSSAVSEGTSPHVGATQVVLPSGGVKDRSPGHRLHRTDVAARGRPWPSCAPRACLTRLFSRGPFLLVCESSSPPLSQHPWTSMPSSMETATSQAGTKSAEHWGTAHLLVRVLPSL